MSGDRIALLTHVRARGKESGADVEMDFVEHWQLRDGRLLRREGELATPEGLAAHGLAGDAAELILRGYAAWTARDEETLLFTVHPDIEWHTVELFLASSPSIAATTASWRSTAGCSTRSNTSR